jgi:multidrug resistance efflux pump
MAELRLSAARRNVAALPAAWSARIDAARARVAQAQAELDAAHAKLDLLHAGPLASEIAAAEARVTQAESGLFAAQVTLRRTILRAPFAGTVTQLPAEAGDTVALGQPVVVLATLDQLQVETTDLTEFDVVHVAVRESVTITVDALPERAFRGTVVAIDARGEPVLDDMTYMATIKLQNPPPTLMWGMTALIDFPH